MMKKFIRDFLLLLRRRDSSTAEFPSRISASRSHSTTSCSTCNKIQYSSLSHVTVRGLEQQDGKESV
jgi:hypothetical protein